MPWRLSIPFCAGFCAWKFNCSLLVQTSMPERLFIALLCLCLGCASACNLTVSVPYYCRYLILEGLCAYYCRCLFLCALLVQVYVPARYLCPTGERLCAWEIICSFLVQVLIPGRYLFLIGACVCVWEFICFLLRSVPHLTTRWPVRPGLRAHLCRCLCICSSLV